MGNTPTSGPLKQENLKQLGIQSVDSASKPPSAPLKGESYWDLVLRQFRRNHLAVGSVFFVLTLFMIAIAAPFLANNRPLVLKGSYRSLYSNRFQEWKLGAHPELVNSLRSLQQSANQESSGQLQLRLRTVHIKLEYLASQLPAAQAQALRGYLKDYDRAVQIALTGNRDILSRQLEKLDKDYQETSARFDPAKVSLKQKLYWPVFDLLTPLDIFFFTLVAMLLLRPFIRRVLPSNWVGSWEAQALVVVLPPILLAALWSMRPAVFDTMDYKEDIFNGRIESTFALFPPIPYGINEGHLGDKYHSPNRLYRLGTDGNGRDLLTRMIWGSRISLSVGFVAVGIYVVIGILVGTLAGYYRGWVDIILSRLIEIVICFPAFFLILAVLAFLQPGLLNIMVVIGITGWTTEARLVRGEFLRLADQEFVLAAKALGVSSHRIIFRHILPNGLAPLLVAASFGVASAILIESSLSFLGFGISIPVPSWGGILNEARENFRYWWITIFPGLAIFSTVTAYNLVGEGIRDAIDPRLKV